MISPPIPYSVEAVLGPPFPVKLAILNRKLWHYIGIRGLKLDGNPTGGSRGKNYSKFHCCIHTYLAHLSWLWINTYEPCQENRVKEHMSTDYMTKSAKRLFFK